MRGSQIKQPRGSTPIAFFKDTHSGESHIDLRAEDQQSPIELLKTIVGVNDVDLALDIIGKASEAIKPLSGNTENTLDSFNIVIQSLHDLQPKSSVEARLIAQSATLYAYGMKCLQRAENQDIIQHAEYYTNKAIKLLRLHNETIETLNRYRRNGEQKITVQHAVVANKAIVNNFSE